MDKLDNRYPWGEYKLGAVVQIEKNGLLEHPTDIGHIVGFGRNTFDEVILKISVSDSDEVLLYHPGNVKLL